MIVTCGYSASVSVKAHDSKKEIYTAKTQFIKPSPGLWTLPTNQSYMPGMQQPESFLSTVLTRSLAVIVVAYVLELVALLLNFSAES